MLCGISCGLIAYWVGYNVAMTWPSDLPQDALSYIYMCIYIAFFQLIYGKIAYFGFCTKGCSASGNIIFFMLLHSR